MGDVVLPEFIVRNIVTEQQRRWNPILQQLDRHLSLIPPYSNPPVVAMKAERWHLHRKDEFGNDTYIAIEGPGGEFREMDERMLETLKRMDMHSERTRRIREENNRRREEQKKRAEQAVKDQRVEQIVERVESKMRTSILVPRNFG
jgi:hypothetical protein